MLWKSFGDATFDDALDLAVNFGEQISRIRLGLNHLSPNFLGHHSSSFLCGAYGDLCVVEEDAVRYANRRARARKAHLQHRLERSSIWRVGACSDGVPRTPRAPNVSIATLSRARVGFHHTSRTRGRRKPRVHRALPSSRLGSLSSTHARVRRPRRARRRSIASLCAHRESRRRCRASVSRASTCRAR